MNELIALFTEAIKGAADGEIEQHAANFAAAIAKLVSAGKDIYTEAKEKIQAVKNGTAN